STPPWRSAARSRRTDMGVTDGAAATRHIWSLLSTRASQAEDSGPGPVGSDDALCDEGDRGGLRVDRQASLDGLLGGAPVVHRMSLAKGQVRDDVVEPAAEGRVIREGAVDVRGQGAKGSGVARTEPEHLLAKPVGVAELEAERAHGGEQTLEFGEFGGADHGR